MNSIVDRGAAAAKDAVLENFLKINYNLDTQAVGNYRWLIHTTRLKENFRITGTKLL